MFTLITWLRQCLSEFSTVSFLSSLLLSMLYSWKKVTMYVPYLRIGKLYSTSLRAEYVSKLFGILLHIYLSSPYLFNYLFIAVWTLAYLFHILGCNLLLFYFVAQIVLAWAISSSFNWLLCCLNIQEIVNVLSHYI